MADLILHKRSSTASAVPSAGSIALGELAINTADARLFLKKGDGTVVDVTSIGGIQGLTAALAGKMANPMTAAGDMIRGGTSGAPERVAAGTNGHVMTIVSGVPDWAAPGDLLSSLAKSEVAVTGALTLTSSAFGRMHVCSGTSNNYSIVLPAVAGNAGKLIGFRMAPGLTRLVTLDGNASEQIDGRLTRVMWANEVAILLCDGTTWTKIAGKSIPMVCEMYPTSSINIAHGTNTRIPLAAVVRDNSGAIADPSTNQRMNIPRPGLWRTQGIVYYQPGTQVMQQNHCRIHVNGTLAPLGVNIQALGTPAADAYFNQHDVVLTLAGGDYVELYAYHNSASSAARALYVNSTAFTYLALVEQNSW